MSIVFFDHYLQQRRQPPRHNRTLGFGAGTEPIDVTVAADDSAGARMEEKKYQPFSSLVAVVVVAPVEPAMVVVGARMVREVFMIHVGGTRCVTSSTGNNMKIQARITLTVEFIRGCIFIFLFYV